MKRPERGKQQNLFSSDPLTNTEARKVAKKGRKKTRVTRKGASSRGATREKERAGIAVRKTPGNSAATAESMGRAQREISVSEFFTKNRHLLGFDNPRKALLTGVKEAVDNSLDACEEAGIRPELLVEIRALAGSENRFTVVIEDNGPGIVKNQVPNIFGKLLYGSKFHRLRQSRGQQGIGISAAGMYGQLTTGNPVRITSRTGKRASAHYFEVRLNTTKNKPEFTDREVDWDMDHGTRVEIDMEAEYRRGLRSVDEYLKQTAVSNPHVRIVYRDPSGNETVYERGTDQMPQETREIKPHPYGVELGLLIKLLHDTKERTITSFLRKEFSRVGDRSCREICNMAGLSARAHPKRIAKAEADRLHAAMNQVKILAPPTNCIAPIGEEILLAGLQK
ncbi:MAG: DNA topoisomerase VI subunit B, partial [Planctomycetota bacterium]